ncbi:MAG: four-carbon acid sugar kinase family protein [Faecalibacterium prausnitzii]
MRLTEITDDLTGAADSGSYFTARGRKVRICTNGRCGLEHEADEILTVNLSSRNTAQDKARRPRRLRRLERRLLYEEDWHRSGQ